MRRIVLLGGLLLISSCRSGASTRSYPAPPPESGARSPGELESDEPTSNLQEELTLVRALSLAMTQNPRLEAIRRELEFASARRMTAGQWRFNPEVFAGLEGALPLGGGEDNAAVLGLSQEFEIGGQRGHRVSIAEMNIERTLAVTSDAERIVRAAVASTFFEGLMLDERARLARENVAIGQKLLEAAEGLFEAKQIPEVDLNLVRLQYQRTRNESVSVDARRRASRLRLSALLGEPGQTDFPLAGSLKTAEMETERAQALETAQANRPDLRALAHAARMAEERVELEKAQVWPSVTLGAFFGRDTLFVENLSDRDNSVGLAVSVPIPLLNKRRGEIAEQRARLRILQASIADLTRQIERDVDLALNRMALARETVELYEQRLNRLSRTNLEEFEKAYRAGEVGTLEVLRAQEDYNRVTAGYQEALFEHSAATVELEAVVGGRISE